MTVKKTTKKKVTPKIPKATKKKVVKKRAVQKKVAKAKSKRPTKKKPTTKVAYSTETYDAVKGAIDSTLNFLGYNESKTREKYVNIVSKGLAIYLED